jgi:hypothetical protein
MRECAINTTLLIPKFPIGKDPDPVLSTSKTILLHVTFLSPPWTSNKYSQQKTVLIPCIPIKIPCTEHSLKDFTALTILSNLHKLSHHIMSYTVCATFLTPNIYPNSTFSKACNLFNLKSKWACFTPIQNR